MEAWGLHSICAFQLRHFWQLSSSSTGVRGQGQNNETLTLSNIWYHAQGHFSWTDFFRPKQVSSSLMCPNLNLPALEAAMFLSDNSHRGEAGITPPTSAHSRPRNRSIVVHPPPMNLLWQSLTGLAYRDSFRWHTLRFTLAIFPVMLCPPTTLPPTVLLLGGDTW